MTTSFFETRDRRRMEIAQENARGATEVRLVPTVVGGRSEMLPDDPFAVAKLLKERRAKLTPAQKAKAKMAASLKARGI
jgi:hypothetical protein